MKFAILLFLSTVLAASLALPQTTTPASAPKKKTTPAKTSTARTGAVKSSTAKAHSATTSVASTARTASTSKKGRTSKKTVAAYRQLTPTPDRYREIQQALVDKGYLKSEPSGVWDAQSSDALKQFQTENKLTPTGKISSASLIGLGLGPKTDDSASSAPPATPPTATAGDTATRAATAN